MDASHAREIDDQAVITNAQAAPVVAATANRREEPGVAGEIDGCYDVRNVRASRDEARPSINHRVVHLPGVLVPGIAGLEQFAAQACLEGIDFGFV